MSISNGGNMAQALIKPEIVFETGGFDYLNPDLIEVEFSMKEDEANEMGMFDELALYTDEELLSLGFDVETISALTVEQ